MEPAVYLVHDAVTAAGVTIQAFVFIRVEQPGAAEDTCNEYLLSYDL